MFGKVIIRNDSDFVIFVDPAQYGSGYNVVPKEIDPWNAYDIEEVRQYVIDNPNMVVDGYDPVPEITIGD